MTTHSVAIGEVAVLNPKQPGRAADNSMMVPFIPMAAVRENGGVVVEDRRLLTDLDNGYTYFEKGDVLLAKITPCFENGKAAHLGSLSHPFGFGSTEFHVLRAGPHLDSRYLYHAVRSPHFLRSGVSRMTGSAGQQRVPAGFVARYQIPLPPLAAQRRIAEKLDMTDAIRRKRQESLWLLDALLRAAFMEMFGTPASNEKGWEISQMGDVISETQYGTSALANSRGQGLPVLRMNNITPSGVIDLTALKWCDIEARDFDKYTVRRGDLLFNRTNSPELVGKTAVWDRDELYAFAGYLVRVRFDQSRVLPEYACGYLNSTYGKRMLFEKAKPSINMSNISPTELKRLPIPVPPLNVQKRYIELGTPVKVMAQRITNTISVSEALYGSFSERAFEPINRTSPPGIRGLL